MDGPPIIQPKPIQTQPRSHHKKPNTVTTTLSRIKFKAKDPDHPPKFLRQRVGFLEKKIEDLNTIVEIASTRASEAQYNSRLAKKLVQEVIAIKRRLKTDENRLGCLERDRGWDVVEDDS